MNCRAGRVVAQAAENLDFQEAPYSAHIVNVYSGVTQDVNRSCLLDDGFDIEQRREDLFNRRGAVDCDQDELAALRLFLVGPDVGDQFDCSGVLLAELEPALLDAEICVDLPHFAQASRADLCANLPGLGVVRVPGLYLDVSHLWLSTNVPQVGRRGQIRSMPPTSPS